MPRSELNEIIEERLTAADIVADGDHHVLAVDVLEPWAAVFQFQVEANGDFDTETAIAQRFHGRRWESLSSGGFRGAGWELPWSRPAVGAHGDHLLGLGLTGRDVEDAAEQAYELVAACGFASSATDEILVTSTGTERTIVPAATGAYVAIGLGDGYDFLTLTPMRNGTPLGAPISAPRPP